MKVIQVIVFSIVGMWLFTTAKRDVSFEKRLKQMGMRVILLQCSDDTVSL